jgi:hypothetical protein
MGRRAGDRTGTASAVIVRKRQEARGKKQETRGKKLVSYFLLLASCFIDWAGTSHSLESLLLDSGDAGEKLALGKILANQRPLLATLIQKLL